MDVLQQVKAKLEEMKAKYNFERENEDNPNHSDGCGMFYSGFFACLKEISFFVDNLEVKEVDLEKEYEKYYEQERYIQTFKLAKHFFELGMRVSNKARKGE